MNRFPVGPLLILLLLASTSSCTHVAHTPSPTPAASRSDARFDLHSGAWINLHNVLYGQGLKLRGKPTREGGGAESGGDGLESIDKTTLDADERARWDAAVSFYASTLSERSVTFDDELETISNKLSALEAAADLSGSGLAPMLVQHLERAMPVYQAHWWAEHDRSNRAWIASIKPYIVRYGGELSPEFARLYRVELPKTPFRVDVTRYASWAGAYSTLNPETHLTISGFDERNDAATALETLYHETSHGLIRPIRNALAKELAAQGKSADSLWHALLFFTAGNRVRHRIAGYVPYAYRYGLYDRGDWRTYRPILETQWAPYIEGRKDFDTAIHDVVKAL